MGQEPERDRVGWRLLITQPAPGAWNMAVDECLMESVRSGGAPTLRFYRWSPPCLSLGRNQPAEGIYSREMVPRLGVESVRRMTGGRAVLHDRELTYSVVAPSRALGGPRTAYQLINEVLVAALGKLGVVAELQGQTAKTAPVPSTIPCFAEPLPGEVLVGGRKLIGSAQLHADGVLLQHGSILLDRSPLIDSLERDLEMQIEGEAAYLGDGVSTDDLISAIADAWADAIGTLTEATLTAVEGDRVDALTPRFLNPDWTWRR